MKMFQVVVGIVSCVVITCGVVLVAEQPSATSESRPNILICIADDASFPHMGIYGCSWVNTPGFDRVAKEGVIFTRAYTPNAKCSPSRSCFLTGRNPWQLEAAANHIPYFPAKFKTYPEILSQNDYFVGMTEKGWAPGIAVDENGSPRQMAGRPFNARKLTPPTRHISTNNYTENFRDFLNAKPVDQPWCFWYGSIEPHRAYEANSGRLLGGKKTEDIDWVPGFWPDNEVVRNDMLDYAFELEYFDKHLVQMLDELEKRGELANTIVIVTADNGMPFPRAKGQSYEMACHLPFAVLWKNGIMHPGRIVDDFVSFIDVAPTILELAQIDAARTGMQPMTGSSFSSLLFSDKSGQVDPTRDHVILGRERNDIGRPNDQGYPIRAMVKDNFMYLHNFAPERWPSCDPITGYLDTDGSPTKAQVISARTQPDIRHLWQLSFGKRGREELYDLSTDSDCLHNLADRPERQELLMQMKNELFSSLTEQGDPRMLGQGDVFDNCPHADEGTRNFYERYLKGERMNSGWVWPSDFEKDVVE